MHFKKHFFFTPDADLLQSLFEMYHSCLLIFLSRNAITSLPVDSILLFLVGSINNFIFSAFVGVLSQMMLTPAMQGVILAIAKARQTFDKEGPEAGLIKVCFGVFLQNFYDYIF